jgi:large subunit ribosomal protein L24
MKAEFNKSWNSSVQPRKQVKFRANAPNHIKRKFMGSSLDKELREKYGRKTIEVRKGDEVKVMRGKFKGKQGKVGMVDVKNTRLQIDGIQRAGKAGGEKLITWFHPSKVKIIILNVEDNRRLKTRDGSQSKTEDGSSKKDGSASPETGATEKADVTKKVAAKKKTKKEAPLDTKDQTGQAKK